MSGRLVITLTLSLCFLLVGVALWKRSTGTAQVRHYFGAREAHLIQHAAHVEVRPPSQASAVGDWQDISSAPGLIHLRATLVDDRYYQWPAIDNQTSDTNTTWVFRFHQADESFELGIDTQDGSIHNLETHQSVKLIPASHKAITAFLPELLNVAQASSL